MDHVDLYIKTCHISAVYIIFDLWNSSGVSESARNLAIANEVASHILPKYVVSRFL